MTIAGIGKVVLWMTGTLLSFSVMAVSVRQLGRTMSVFEILTLRSLGGLVILLAVLLARPRLMAQLAPRQSGLHFVRNALHFAAGLAWTQSIAWLPLATVFALEFTMPAWVALFAVGLLGEQMTVSRAGSVALCFLGILIVVRPGLDVFNPAALLVLAAAIGYALSNIVTKKLTMRVSTVAILCWMNLMQLPMGLVGCGSGFLLKIGVAESVPLIGLAVSGYSAHFCLTNAFRFGDATVVLPLDFLRLPLIAIIGWWLYGESLDLLVFAGGACILGGVLWNLVVEARRQTSAGAVYAQSG